MKLIEDPKKIKTKTEPGGAKMVLERMPFEIFLHATPLLAPTCRDVV